MAALGALVALAGLGGATDAYQRAALNRLKIDAGQQENRDTEAAGQGLSSWAGGSSADALSLAAMGNASRMMQPPQPPPQPQPQAPPPGQPPAQPQQGGPPPAPGGQGPQFPPGGGGPQGVPPWAARGLPGAPGVPPMGQQPQLMGAGRPQMGGGPMAQPPFPQSKMMPGGPPGMGPNGPTPPPQPGMAGGAPPGVGSGPSGAGGMQPAIPVPGGPPHGFDWRGMVQAIQKANPGIDGRTLAGAVNKMLPFMNAASRQEWLMAHNQFLEQQLQQRGMVAGMQEAGRNYRADQAADVKHDLAQMTDDRIRDIAGQNQGLRMALQQARDSAAMDRTQANIGSREGIAEGNRESREGIATGRNTAAQTRTETQQAGADRRSQAGIESREGMQTQRLASALDRLKVSTQSKMALAQLTTGARAELAQYLDAQKGARFEMSENLKRELAQAKGIQAADLQKLKGEQAADRQATAIGATAERDTQRQGFQAGQQTQRIDAAADRTADTIESRESEGDKNRATRTGIADANRTAATGKQAGTSQTALDRASRQDKAIALRDPEIRADTSSLTQLTKNYDAVEAFSSTANRNGDKLLKLAETAGQTGYPVFRKWVNAGRRATGDADVARFDAQLRTYSNEIAKILTNPNLTGQLTNKAREEMETFLHSGTSLGQLQGIVSLLRSDADNRKIELTNQRNAITKRIDTRMDKLLGKKPTSGTEGWKIEEIKPGG